MGLLSWERLTHGYWNLLSIGNGSLRVSDLFSLREVFAVGSKDPDAAGRETEDPQKARRLGFLPSLQNPGALTWDERW